MKKITFIQTVHVPLIQVKGHMVGIPQNTTIKSVDKYQHINTQSQLPTELMAILSVLGFIKDHPTNSQKINIFADCQTVLQYLNFNAYPKYNNIKQVTEAIFKTLSIIQSKNPSLKLYLKKVKSHSNIPGNKKIDEMVRRKTYTIKYKMDQFKYIPYTVTLTQIHQYLNKLWKTTWKTKSNPNRWITKCHKRFNTKINTLILFAKLNRTNVA